MIKLQGPDSLIHSKTILKNLPGAGNNSEIPTFDIDIELERHID